MYGECDIHNVEGNKIREYSQWNPSTQDALGTANSIFIGEGMFCTLLYVARALGSMYLD